MPGHFLVRTAPAAGAPAPVLRSVRRRRRALGRGVRGAVRASCTRVSRSIPRFLDPVGPRAIVTPDARQPGADAPRPGSRRRGVGHPAPAARSGPPRRGVGGSSRPGSVRSVRSRPRPTCSTSSRREAGGGAVRRPTRPRPARCGPGRTEARCRSPRDRSSSRCSRSAPCSSPYAPLPLHVFEPRYRALVEACLEGEPEFGVVLIERGSEVGGGDTRFDVATVARILQVGRADDGRYVLGTVGTRRLRVVRWLDDAPYPRAEVEAFDDPPARRSTPSSCADVARLLIRVLALRAELGERGRRRSSSSTTIRCAPRTRRRPVPGSGRSTRSQLLAAPGATDRLTLLRGDARGPARGARRPGCGP